MFVHGNKCIFFRMNLGGTAGDRFCPILTWDRGFFIAHSAG